MSSRNHVHASETEAAVSSIHEHGFVIIEDAVPKEPLAVLRERMDRDTEELLAYCESIGGNPRERGHLQQGPPVSSAYVFADVAMNRYVNRICNELYKYRPRLTFYNGNTNCPGSTTQGLHMDGRHATLAPETQVGDVLIRDTRLWHRGVPNPSDRPRHMIALIVTDGRLPVRGRLDFQKGCEDALEGHTVDSNANYVDEEIDYLLSPTRRIHMNRQAALQEQKERDQIAKSET